MNVAVFLGGTSPEREVSLASGLACAQALREAGHKVRLIDPAFGASQPESFNGFLANGIHEVPPDVRELSKFSNARIVETVSSHLLDDIDVVFLALHGKWGEDGTVQALLELRGIPYTGSRVLASALAMNKEMAKHMFLRHGVRTPTWQSWRTPPHGAPLDSDTIYGHVARELGFPVVIKPNDQGSTVGVSIVHSGDLSEFEKGLQQAAMFSDTILIEQYIPGREVTVGILGNEALPVVEVRPKDGFYDYQHKYTKGMTEYIVPAELPEAVALELQGQALRAFQSLGCSGFGRIDFRLSPENIPYCLEVNTIPGMTALSLVPKAARAAGISFPELCERIISLALQSMSADIPASSKA